MNVIIDGKRILLRDDKIIGKGGEADIYDIGSGRVAKIFKTPTHPDLDGNPYEQKVAAARIAEHQKKLPAFPKGLPVGVVVPEKLVYDERSGNIGGYVMPFFKNSEVLYSYGERPFRERSGIQDASVIGIYQKLHPIIAGIHRAGAVIGDFNDLNVLVVGEEPKIIDADSMQFGGFLSKVFTEKFVDPLLCDPKAQKIMLHKPHNEDSDWYTFAVMLMQALLWVGPYGGVHTPKDSGKKLKDWARRLSHITVFHPDVRYPKPARPYGILPDDLLEVFHRIFEKDVRGAFPLEELRSLRFTTCTSCGMVHARAVCPSCTVASPAITKEVITASIEVRKVFETSGQIIFAVVQGDSLRYVYHKGNAFHREGGTELLKGSLDPLLRFRISGKRTVLARENQGIVINPDGQAERFPVGTYFGRSPIVDATREGIFTISGEAVTRYGSFGMDYPENLPVSVLSGRTLLWVSETLGFTLYQAGRITTGTVFEPQSKAFGKEVSLPALVGKVLDMTTVFSGQFVWLLVSIEENGVRTNRAYAISREGNLEATAEAPVGDDSWLGTIRGKCATGKLLFSPTDDGIVRTEMSGGNLVATKSFADTNRFVDSGSRLLLRPKGEIFAITGQRIWSLKMK